MPLDRRRIDPPRDEQDFENWCQSIYRQKLNAPQLKLFGRRGQRQHGIDLIGHSSDGKLVVVQAKLRNLGELKCEDITKDLELALGHFDDLSHFVFATTQSRDTALQEHVLKLNRIHGKNGLAVEIDCWDDIEDILHEPEYGEIYQRLNGTPVTHNRSTEVSLLPDEKHAQILEAIDGISVPGDPFDKQIENASEYLKNGRPSTTYDLLTDLKNQHWDELNNRLKYRVLANIGNALHGLDRFLEAADHWIDAYTYQQTVTAELLYARGLQFQGECVKAMESVNRILKQEPESGSAYTVAINVRDDSYAESLEYVPKPVQLKAEVALALSYKALDEQLFDSAEQHVRDALADSPGWAVAKTNLAVILLSQIKTSFQTDINGKPILSETGQLKKAETLLSSTIADGVDLSPYSKAMAHYNRASVRYLMGKDDDGLADLQEAHRLHPDDSEILATLATRHELLGNIPESIRLLEQAYQNSTDNAGVALLLAAALGNRNEGDDLQRALRVAESRLSNIASKSEDQKFDYLQIVCGLRIQNPEVKIGTVQSLVADLGGYLTENGFRVLIAEQSRRLGEMLLAENESIAVVDSGFESLSEVEALSLGKTLLACEQPGLAKLVLRKGASSSSFTQHTFEFLQSAERTDDASIILNYCTSLLDHGCTDEFVLDLLTEYRRRFEDFHGALEVLNVWCKLHPENLRPKIWRGIIAKPLGDLEVVEDASQSLPSPEEIPQSLIEASVGLLSLSKNGVPIDFVYEIWRANPKTEAACKSLVSRVIFDPLEIDSQDAVSEFAAPGDAVFVDVEHSDSRWIWLRDGGAKSELDEVDIDSEKGKVLLGKKVGDTFDFEQTFQSSKATVCAILPGARVAAQVCMDQWERRFPDTGFVQAFRMNSVSDNPTKEELDKSIQPMVEMAKSREVRAKSVLGEYQKFRLTTWLFSKHIGRSHWDSVTGLLLDENTRFLDADPHEIGRLVNIATSSRSLVLDLTSIVFMSKLEILELVLCEYEVVVPQRLLSALEEQLQSMEFSSRSTSSFHTVDGKPIVVDHDVNAQQVERNFLANAVSLIKSKAKIVDGYALTKLDNETAGQLEGIYGPAGARSIAYASVSGCLLCQDDGVFTQLVSTINVKRVTTAAIIESLRKSSAISLDQSDGLLARLIQWKVLCVPLRGGVVASYCKLQSWDSKSDKLDSLFSMFERSEASARQLAVLLLEIIKSIWAFEGALNKDEILRVIFKKLDNRHDGRLIIRGALVAVEQSFGLDVVSAADVTAIIEAWLRTPPPTDPFSLIVSP